MVVSNEILKEELAAEIKKLLADLHLHYQNLRNFHWNVKGPHFFTLHEKFEELYHHISSKIDETAERSLTLGASPNASLLEYISLADIEEENTLKDAEDMVYAAIRGHEQLIKDVRKVLKIAEQGEDEGTVDIFSGYPAELEKTNWMLRSYLG